MGIIYFLVYLFLEIVFSYEFMKVFTPLGFFIETLITAIIGVYIIKNIHFSLNENMMKLLRREISEEEFISVGFFKFIGAVLLIIPGFFSDIVGALFLFEPFARWIARKFLPKEEIHIYTNHSQYNDNEIIDVEIIEELPKK